MANIRANITLQSPGVMSSPLSLSASTNLLADSGSLIRGKVLGTSVGADATVINKPSDKLDVAYVFIQNLATEKEDYIYIYADTAADDPVIMKLAAGS